MSVRVRLKEVASGQTISWPTGANKITPSNDISILEDMDEHRIQITGAGTPTVKYRIGNENAAQVTLTPPAGYAWTDAPTFLMSGIYEFEVSSAGGDIVVDVLSTRVATNV